MASTEAEGIILSASYGTSVEHAESTRPSSKPSVRRKRTSRRKATNVPVYESTNWLAFQYFSQGRYDLCMECCVKGLQQSQNVNPYLLYVKGLVERAQGKLDDSLESLKRALNLESNNTETALQIARNLYLLGRYKAAIATFDRVISAAGGAIRWRVLLDRSRCYLKMDQPDQARGEAEAAVASVPNVYTLTALAKAQQACGNPRGAIDAYTQALGLAREDPDVMIELGLLHLLVGEASRAFELFGTALSYDPKDAKAILAAGSIIQDNEDYDVALVKYRVSAVRTPESPELWNNIGMCFYGKKKTTAAIACLKHAIYLAPFEWMIAFNLGLVHLSVNQTASAFHFFTAAANLKPTFAPCFGLLAVALYRLGDVANAESAFDKALELDPNDLFTLVNSISMLVDLGQMALARKRWSKFKEVAATRKAFLKENPELSASAKAISNRLKVVGASV